MLREGRAITSSCHQILPPALIPDNHFTIPFSLGFKFNAGKRLSAGVEWSPRKTFNDRIDGVENFSTDNGVSFGR